ncbi:MAG: hypothetical protein ACFE0Q_06300 [Anaerolineae bacterium]
MKRMLIIWSGLIVLVILASLFHPPLSLVTNTWTINVLILLTLLWLIELGLVHYRSHSHDIDALLRDNRRRSRSRERDDRYIAQHTKDT